MIWLVMLWGHSALGLRTLPAQRNSGKKVAMGSASITSAENHQPAPVKPRGAEGARRSPSKERVCSSRPPVPSTSEMKPSQPSVVPTSFQCQT